MSFLLFGARLRRGRRISITIHKYTNTQIQNRNTNTQIQKMSFLVFPSWSAGCGEGRISITIEPPKAVWPKIMAQ